MTSRVASGVASHMDSGVASYVASGVSPVLASGLALILPNTAGGFPYMWLHAHTLQGSHLSQTHRDGGEAVFVVH